MRDDPVNAHAEKIVHADVVEGIGHFRRTKEDPRVQTRRIICRMVGDLIQPSVHRSGSIPPTAPDMQGGRVRLDGAKPYTTLPPQCDVGFSSMLAVGWQDVVRLIPCLAAETALDSITATIRSRACLLDDDSLMLVNQGPRRALPTPTGTSKLVRDGDPKLNLWRRCEHLATTACRPLDARILPLQTPHPDLLILPPNPHPVTDRNSQEENILALRLHFHPSRFVSHLEVDHEDGMGSLHMAGYHGAFRSAASMHNHIWVRWAIIRFLEEAMVQAPYAARLVSLFGGQDPDFAGVQRAMGSPRPLINQLVSTLGRTAVDRLPYWPNVSASIQRRTGDFIMLEPEHTLMFHPPSYASSDADFLGQLLSIPAFVLVKPTSSTHFFR